MLISMAKKGWRRFLRSTVTRRDGWLWLVERTAASSRGLCRSDGPREGELIVLEAIEWSPRVGVRWACDTCGALGPKVLRLGAIGGNPRHRVCDCDPLALTQRLPRRGRYIRVLDARREALADMDEADLAAEGLPELAMVEFWRLFLGCAPSWSDDEIRRAASRQIVTRIEYEHLEARP